MNYTCYYYEGTELPEPVNRRSLERHACFGTPFYTCGDIILVVPMEQGDGVKQNWIFTEKEAYYFIGIVKRYFGGITKTIKTEYPLSGFKNKRGPVKCLMVHIRIDTLKFSLNKALNYKAVLTLVRYLYETPYTDILHIAIKKHKKALKNKYDISFMTIFLNLHKRCSKINNNHYGTGHSFSQPYSSKLVDHYLKFSTKSLCKPGMSASLTYWSSNEMSIIRSKTKLKQLKQLIEK